MTERISLDYGRGSLSIEVPAGIQWTVLDKPSTTARDLSDSEQTEAVRAALECPIGCPPLLELAKGRRDAVVVVSDRTRPVPNQALLPELFRTLLEGGVPRDQIRIMVATGLHRAATQSELAEILGPEIPKTFTIWQHDAHDRAMHRSLGISRHGIPIEIDRRYLDADLKIVTGLIEPHLMAGYSGGRKAVCPGLASAATIRVAHGARMLEGPLGPGLVQGNPLHMDLTDIARQAGVDFMLNVSLDGDRRISGIFAGDLERAFELGCDSVERESLVSLEQPADVVLVSGGGDPLDATFYQAIKGIVTAASIVREGGVILLCASLSEGIGSRSFEELILGSETPAAFERRLQEEDFIAVDQWMIQHLCQAWRRASVWLYTDGLPRPIAERLLVRAVEDPSAALARAVSIQGPSSRVAVLPQGPYVLATVRGTKRAVGHGTPLSSAASTP